MKYQVIHTERVMTSYVYNVEAESEEAAVDKYINELAGGLNEVDSWISDDTIESVKIFKD